MSMMTDAVLLVFLIACSLHWVAPEHIQCTRGTLNVILSAPHGGTEKPTEIPDRVGGCYVNGQCVYRQGCRPDRSNCYVSTLRDSYTKELAILVAERLEELTHKKPHMVINNLYRGKMDANRNIDEAAFGNPVAEAAYEEYHRCIVRAKEAIESDASVNNIGLFVDIHGQGHPNNWAELGYAIPKTSLNAGDFSASDSSIKALASRRSEDFDTVLRGSLSFGHFLEAEGYNAVPSPNHWRPGSDKYFSGGYITKVYGSKERGGVDAIQIESSKEQRSEGERADYAAALARAIVNFMNVHY